MTKQELALAEQIYLKFLDKLNVYDIKEKTNYHYERLARTAYIATEAFTSVKHTPNTPPKPHTPPKFL